MIRSATRKTLFALYQFAVAVGIFMLPVAMAVRKTGVPMPVHRLFDRLEAALERTDPGA